MNANTVVSSLVGRALRLAGPVRFKGKGRLVHHWLEHRDVGFQGRRKLPGGGEIRCGFDVPYEAMVWARQEEESDLGVLEAMLSPGDHFVDCGANVGLWSLVAAGWVGPRGRVTAFEPNPSAYQRLTQNLEDSGEVGRRVTAVNVAVAERRGRVGFDTGAQHNLGHVVAEPGAGLSVAAVSLDEHFGDQPVHAIKLDIEGGEAPALRGASGILESQRPWLCVEFNVAIAGSDRIGDWNVFTLLRGFGYRCRAISGFSGRIPGPIIAADDRFAGYVNVLFEPPDA